MSEGEFKCDFILARMKKMLEIEEECKSFGRNNILPENILADTSPYFYPFIIEFSLIGASVFYIMSNHVGKQTSRLKLRQPNPMDCFNKIEFSHLMKVKKFKVLNYILSQNVKNISKSTGLGISANMYFNDFIFPSRVRLLDFL